MARPISESDLLKGFVMNFMPCREADSSGFSLIELLMVLVIACVVGALAAPSFARWLEAYRARIAARQVATDLQFAKIRAISEKVQYRLSFNKGRKSYTIQRGNHSSGSTVWTQVGIARCLADKDNPYFSRGIDLNDNCSGHHATFSPSGNASGCTVMLMSPNYHKNVVLGLTGRTRIE